VFVTNCDIRDCFGGTPTTRGAAAQTQSRPRTRVGNQVAQVLTATLADLRGKLGSTVASESEDHAYGIVPYLGPRPA
jgi:hypothetical protein